MAISLVSAPALCFDLVLHPDGADIADILAWALDLAPGDRSLFETAWSRVDSDERAAAWTRVRDREITNSMRRATFTDLDDLSSLLAGDILDWQARSPAGKSTDNPVHNVLWDGIACVWTSHADERDAAVLGSALSEVRHRRTRNDTTVELPQIRQLLGRLATLPEAGRDRLRTVNSLLGPGGTEWSDAVNEASWAALTTGRIRTAAKAQLRAVQAFVWAGLTPYDGARGVWNLVSGAVQANVVADVLSTASHDRLTRGWRAAVGN